MLVLGNLAGITSSTGTPPPVAPGTDGGILPAPDGGILPGMTPDMGGGILPIPGGITPAIGIAPRTGEGRAEEAAEPGGEETGGTGLSEGSRVSRLPNRKCCTIGYLLNTWMVRKSLF